MSGWPHAPHHRTRIGRSRPSGSGVASASTASRSIGENRRHASIETSAPRCATSRDSPFTTTAPGHRRVVHDSTRRLASGTISSRSAHSRKYASPLGSSRPGPSAGAPSRWATHTAGCLAARPCRVLHGRMASVCPRERRGDGALYPQPSRGSRPPAVARARRSRRPSTRPRSRCIAAPQSCAGDGCSRLVDCVPATRAWIDSYAASCG
jgi:hypothetical protein